MQASARCERGVAEPAESQGRRALLLEVTELPKHETSSRTSGL
jgi:hypothetical protein